MLVQLGDDNIERNDKIEYIQIAASKIGFNVIEIFASSFLLKDKIINIIKSNEIDYYELSKLYKKYFENYIGYEEK
jgi:hypothetical protein